MLLPVPLQGKYRLCGITLHGNVFSLLNDQGLRTLLHFLASHTWSEKQFKDTWDAQSHKRKGTFLSAFLLQNINIPTWLQNMYGFHKSPPKVRKTTQFLPSSCCHHYKPLLEKPGTHKPIATTECLEALSGEYPSLGSPENPTDPVRFWMGVLSRNYFELRERSVAVVSRILKFRRTANQRHHNTFTLYRESCVSTILLKQCPPLARLRND